MTSMRAVGWKSDLMAADGACDGRGKDRQEEQEREREMMGGVRSYGGFPAAAIRTHSRWAAAWDWT
jgi:hypothetical protein